MLFIAGPHWTLGCQPSIWLSQVRIRPRNPCVALGHPPSPTSIDASARHHFEPCMDQSRFEFRNCRCSLPDWRTAIAEPIGRRGLAGPSNGPVCPAESYILCPWASIWSTLGTNVDQMGAHGHTMSGSGAQAFSPNSPFRHPGLLKPISFHRHVWSIIVGAENIHIGCFYHLSLLLHWIDHALVVTYFVPK